MSTPTTPSSSPRTTEVAPVLAYSGPGAATTAVVAEVQPTQLRRPWRTMIRTAFQTAITVIPILGLVVPQIVQIILEETGEHLPDNLRLILLGISAGIVALASIVARVMAIPQVEQLLRRFKALSWLAAAPKS